MKAPEKIKYQIFFQEDIDEIGIYFPDYMHGELEALGHLLIAEIWDNGYHNYIDSLKTMFDNALSGKKEEESDCGDATCYIIKKDFTYIESIAGKEINCTIETERLYKLLLFWWDTLRKWQKKEIELPIEGEF